MKFLNEHTHIMHGLNPIDVNDRKNENTAIELAIPDNFSGKAKNCWRYFDGSAFVFEYKERLVITDEALCWICNSWEELEKIFKDTYDDLIEDGIL